MNEQDWNHFNGFGLPLEKCVMYCIPEVKLDDTWKEAMRYGFGNVYKRIFGRWICGSFVFDRAILSYFGWVLKRLLYLSFQELKFLRAYHHRILRYYFLFKHLRIAITPEVCFTWMWFIPIDVVLLWRIYYVIAQCS